MAKVGDRFRSTLVIQQARKYASMFETLRNQKTLKELIDLLVLTVARRRYWWERAKHFQSKKFAHYYKRSTCEHPDYKLPPTRDCEGYVKGELDKAPWDSEVIDVEGGDRNQGVEQSNSADSVQQSNVNDGVQ